MLPLVAFEIVYQYQDNIADLPYFGQSNNIETKTPHYRVPDFSFTNQDGQPLSASFVKGKIWVGCYFFTSCPSICPKMVAALKGVQNSFRDDTSVRLLSFTVDPERDTYQKLGSYASAKGLDTKQWQLATGDKRDLYRFARNGMFIVATDGNGGPDDFIHSDRVVLTDRQGHIRGYYDGTDVADMQKLVRDIKKLKQTR